ncbi:hypothetical protein HMPREF9554_01984 [Treponema phagedenis F0421]|nr:hypothetical protein HMPREF9554_01984 [Treponema phagedenis F0421]
MLCKEMDYMLFQCCYKSDSDKLFISASIAKQRFYRQQDTNLN